MQRFLKPWLAACLAMLTSLVHAQDSKLPVVASFSILGDIVHNVGGDRVEVTSLVGPDRDSRTYQPTPADADKLDHARLLLVNGLGLENWLPHLRAISHYQGPVAVVTEGIRPRMIREHGKLVPDPNVFQDPVLVKTVVLRIRDALIAADPAGRAYYSERALNYTLALDDLVTWAHKQLAPIPPTRRVIFTAHDDFGYLGERFDIRFITPPSPTRNRELSAWEIGRLARKLRYLGTQAIFAENTTSPQVVERVARDAHLKVSGKLYADALSQTQEAVTYLQLFQHNIRVAVSAMKNNR